VPPVIRSVFPAIGSVVMPGELLGLADSISGIKAQLSLKPQNLGARRWVLDDGRGGCRKSLPLLKGIEDRQWRVAGAYPGVLNEVP